MKYGYARVSTDDQNPDMQLSALQRGRVQDHFQRSTLRRDRR
jgi:DNA invertase Pin-like site-specific DNA recombinase